MNFDLRIPVGLMFSVFGLILSGVGLFGGVDNTKSLGINMNLDWGLFMLLFGAAMLAFAFRSARKALALGETSAPAPAHDKSRA